MAVYNGRTLDTQLIITIDGPAGSGKSTIARHLAERLGIAYLDTGAMYRALTLAALEGCVDLDDGAALTRLAAACRIDLALPEAPDRVYLDGHDVTEAIRRPTVTASAHKLACVAELRQHLVAEQRRIAQRAPGLVTEGRDQGSVVFPGADYKFYLDAAPEIRARRRQAELSAQGECVSYGDTLAAQRERDARDRSRREGPLKVPEDAIVIDTSALTIEEVVQALLDRIGKD